MSPQLSELFKNLIDAIEALPPLAEVIEARKKMMECMMWVQAAIEAEK